MSDLFWLTDEQMERLRPFFPKSHGRLRVDDRRALSGIVFVMFGRLKDWRRVATGYDRCPTAFFSAVALAATVIFWL